MPSTTTTVGGMTLPVPAGTLNSDIEDPTVVGLLDYLAFWIKNSLDTKLANMMADPTRADACPTSNRFDYSPEAGKVWVRNPTPALYCWWDGESVDIGATMLYRHVERTIWALYVFDEIVMPGDAGARSGLTAVVNQTFAKSAERGRHPSYAYGSDAPGTPIAKSLSLVEWWYIGGKSGILWEVPGTGISADGAIQRGFPALKGRFRVVERIEQDTLITPDDVLGDSPLAIDVGDSVQDTVNVLNRVLLPPDGSDPTEP